VVGRLNHAASARSGCDGTVALEAFDPDPASVAKRMEKWNHTGKAAHA
jgi:hypothetical protein